MGYCRDLKFTAFTLLCFHAYMLLKPTAFIQSQVGIFFFVQEYILPVRMLSCKGIQQIGQHSKR